MRVRALDCCAANYIVVNVSCVMYNLLLLFITTCAVCDEWNKINQNEYNFEHLEFCMRYIVLRNVKVPEDLTQLGLITAITLLSNHYAKTFSDDSWSKTDRLSNAAGRILFTKAADIRSEIKSQSDLYHKQTEAYRMEMPVGATGLN